MFDYKLAIHLMLHAFSFRKGSLRYPTTMRLIKVLVALPLFLLLTLTNRFFMLFDHLFFPAFRKMNVRNMVLITGVPRSATTYLHHLLGEDTQNFTCFKLWEILFAPSIIQKYIFSWMLKGDRRIGRPLYRASLQYDRLLTPIARLHETGLSKPEEDEILLLFAFASVYLAYFFPELPSVDKHLLFDEQIRKTKRRKIMKFYKRCIQRHVYFYDRHEKKCFLSKNPSFISKTTSVSETFENARLIYMLRSPLRTIPSTINLNKNVYPFIPGKLSTNPLAAETRDTIVRWYKMADKSIANHWQQNSITIPFRKITGNPVDTVSAIYSFLRLTRPDNLNQLLEVEQKKNLTHETPCEYTNGDEEDLINRELGFIVNGPFRDDL